MKNNIFKNKKFIIPVILILVILSTYKLYALCFEYFDKDGRFVLGGNLECSNISSATLMNDGNVFILTGKSDNPYDQPNYNPACHNIAQIYNTKTGAVKYVGKSNVEHGSAQTILLKNGKILIVGANAKLWIDYPPGSIHNLKPGIINSKYAELFDTKTGKFSFTGEMVHPRSNFSMVLLHDGRVLIIGGYYNHQFIKQTEIFDPIANKFYPAGTLNTETPDLKSVLLKNGNVLIAGGSKKNVELYNTRTNTSKIIGEIAGANQFFSSLILIRDGRVLIFTEDYDNNKIVPTIYNPDSNKFTELSLYDKKRKPVAYTALLPDGKVLIAGGRHPAFIKGYFSISTAEIFDPKTNTFKPIRNHLKIARSGDISVLLKDGNVLILAGYGGTYSPIKQTELFIPKNKINNK